MKDYVFRLEYCNKTQNEKNTERKARSMEDNIISGVEETRTETGKPENIAKMMTRVQLGDEYRYRNS